MMDEVVIVKEIKNSFGPKEGDLTIGLDIIVPIVRAIGTGYSAGTPEQILTDFPSKQTFFAKYFLEDNFAIRAKIQANLINYSDSKLINDDSNLDPLNRTEVEDVRTVNSGEFVLAIGGEFRNNYGKFHTFYGAEIAGLYGYDSEKFHRANAYTSVNTDPTSHDFGGGSPKDTPGSRMISRSGFVNESETPGGNGNYWGLGANIFVGAEYYFTERLALGSEINWGYQYKQLGQKSHVNEYLLGGNVKEETIVTSAGDVSNGLGFTNPYVSLYVIFTF